MELPDFMSYTNKFSQSEFVEKISRIAKRAGAKLVYAALILFYTLQSDQVSAKDKALIIGALGILLRSVLIFFLSFQIENIREQAETVLTVIIIAVL